MHAPSRAPRAAPAVAPGLPQPMPAAAHCPLHPGPCLQAHRVTISNRQHLFIENGALRPGVIPVVGKSARSSVYFADQ